MPANDSRPTLQELRNAIEANFKLLGDSACSTATSDEERGDVLQRMVMRPAGLGYMFGFITAACTEYGYPEMTDVCPTMALVLQNVFGVPQDKILALVDAGLNYAMAGTRDHLDGKLSLLAITYRFADQAGREFVPMKSHLRYIDPYVLVVLAS